MRRALRIAARGLLHPPDKWDLERLAAHMQTSRQAASKRPFREFALRLASADPLVESFVAHAANESFPNVNSWGEVRTYLYKAGAEPNAFVGGRLAWREYISRAKRNRE